MNLIIKGKMPTANEYISAMNRNRFVGAKMKKEQTERVAWTCRAQGLKRFGHITEILFNWYVKDRKKDKDNISFAKKFILDGLQMAGVITNDGWNDIGDFADRFYLDKNERVEVEIL